MRNPQPQPRPPIAAPARGFTLIELMIAITISLLLMIGVNAVFKTTGQTVGTGQVLSGIARDNRAVLNTLNNDFHAMAGDGPSLIIHGEQRWAYRDAQDLAADVDKDPKTQDINGSGGTEPFLAQCLYGTRSHRTDMISFFARDFYTRQTGSGSTFFDPATSYEAWVWYGHASLADNAAPSANVPNFLDPGATPQISNPNNFFATQWVLARMANLLRADAGSVSNGYLQANGTLAPLAKTSPTLPSTTPKWVASNGRYDLAQTSIQSFKVALNSAIKTNTPANINSNGNNQSWSYAYGNNSLNFRFGARSWLPKLAGINAASDSAALIAPCLVTGCTQFMVEYAGDFLTQDAYGTPTSTYSDGATDGQIDFIIDADGSRRVRWYGMPRDVAGGTYNGPDGVINAASDVVPLRDLWKQTSKHKTDAGAPFERVLPTPLSATPVPDYAKISLTGPYTCAWGPNDLVRPKLIRITMFLQDANGRLADAQKFEYVFSCP